MDENPTVVCLHANASTPGQWRALAERLAPHFRVLAPSLYDSGNSAHWPSDRTIRLRDEVALLEPMLAGAGSPLVLVGHSYGAAVALIAALERPERVSAMVLYEPTLFSLIDAEKAPPNDADGIRDVVIDAGAALDAGSAEAAAGRFIDYWMGEGAWSRFPAQRKPAIAASVRNVRRWGHALFTEATPLFAFRALAMPVLYMVGKGSPAPARGVARLLVPVLPQVELAEFHNLGHMGPVTHPDLVNPRIEEFLLRVVSGSGAFA